MASRLCLFNIKLVSSAVESAAIALRELKMLPSYPCWRAVCAVYSVSIVFWRRTKSCDVLLGLSCIARLLNPLVERYDWVRSTVIVCTLPAPFVITELRCEAYEDPICFKCAVEPIGDFDFFIVF